MLLDQVASGLNHSSGVFFGENLCCSVNQQRTAQFERTVQNSLLIVASGIIKKLFFHVSKRKKNNTKIDPKISPEELKFSLIKESVKFYVGKVHD